MRKAIWLRFYMNFLIWLSVASAVCCGWICDKCEKMVVKTLERLQSGRGGRVEDLCGGIWRKQFYFHFKLFFLICWTGPLVLYCDWLCDVIEKILNEKFMRERERGGCAEDDCVGIWRKQIDLDFTWIFLIWQTGPLVVFVEMNMIPYWRLFF